MNEEEEQQKQQQQDNNNNKEEPLVIRLIHANRKAGREENKGVFEYMRLITKVANERGGTLLLLAYQIDNRACCPHAKWSKWLDYLSFITP